MRVLVDHLHAAPEPSGGAILPGDVLALEQNAPPGERQHAQHRQAGGGLATAALADQPQCFAASHAERHAVDGLDDAHLALQEHAARDRKVHGEIFDAQQLAVRSVRR
jgi:hypothetical protein